ncbi:M67 family metallopeptidase [Paenibacillus sp. N4]|uniref:M67 family metallopeptidase n=1 Tax=Paenibacillus vietnamensis TaxID=2590547 RepID=UPI001CD0B594|nr:M67 family metallopeptidase [Paenibacillus vietnamensis]MCA0754649.1 M67 family metallopeptidase [Paenibacillus vietnamensis]
MPECQSQAYITKEAFERLVALCLDAKPIEACGILAGPAADSGDTATHTPEAVIDTVIPITNTHINPTYSFSFDPSEWTTAFYDMQKNRQSLVGLFHSHPKTDAIPSSYDTEGFLPASELTYWIISLKDSQNPVVQPYRRERSKFVPLQLVLA